MQFNIRCETYARLTNALQWFGSNETRAYFKSIYVERRAGQLVAVATNGKILAAQLLDNRSTGPDEGMNLTIDPAMIAQARTEANLNGLMNVNYIPELQHATVKTTFGFQFQGNAALHFQGPNLVKDGWRSIPDTTVEPGPMIISSRDVAHLGAASPSGYLVFPAEIDGAKPVLVTDRVDPNWIGFFMPSHFDDNGRQMKFNAAVIPAWAKP